MNFLECSATPANRYANYFRLYNIRVQSNW